MKTVKQKEYTPESVWQFIQELGEKIDRSIAEADKRAAEADKTLAEFKRTIGTSFQKGDDDLKEAKRISKENSKMIYGISNSNGLFAEEFVLNSLKKNMSFGGQKFDKLKERVQVVDGLDTVTDIDALLLNGDTVALLEVKYKIDKDDVKELISKKLNSFRKYFPSYKDHKFLLGIGAMCFENGAIREANKNGVGIIKVVGEKVEYFTDKIKIY